MDASDGVINADDRVILGDPFPRYTFGIDLTAGYKLNTKWGFELGYTTALWGESTAKGDTWTLALSFKP